MMNSSIDGYYSYHVVVRLAVLTLLRHPQHRLLILYQSQHQLLPRYLAHLPILKEDSHSQHDQTGKENPKRQTIVIFHRYQTHCLVIQCHPHEVGYNHQYAPKMVFEVCGRIVFDKKFRPRYDILAGEGDDFYHIVCADQKGEREDTEAEFTYKIELIKNGQTVVILLIADQLLDLRIREVVLRWPRLLNRGIE